MRLNLGIAVSLIMCLSLGVTVLAATIRWARRTRPGYGRWAIASLLLVLAFILMSLRSAPGWINTLSANAGIALASILYLEGAREFRGLAPRKWLAYAGGAVTVAAVAFFLYIVPNMNVRAMVMSAFLSIVLALVSVRFLRDIPPADRFGQELTGAMFALCAATLMARAFYCYFGPPMSDLNALSGVYGAFFLATVVELAGVSTGLALLADEGVLSDLKDAKQRALLATAQIARQIETEAALRKSEERLRFAQRVARIGTFELNMKTGENTWTPELEEMYGLTPGGYPPTQSEWEALIHPDDRGKGARLVAESFNSETPVEGEWRVILPNGNIRWLTGRWQVFRNAEGEPARMMGVNIDITDRKRIEEALSQSEERFRLAVKATNDAVWVIDLETGIVSWNETYTTLYGRPLATSDSWQWWIDCIHPEDRDRTVSGLRTAISGGASSWTCEYRFQRVDGAWAYIFDRCYIARDASGKAGRVIGAMQDLTERKQVETALRASEQRLKNAERLAHIGHWEWDIRANRITASEETHRMFGSQEYTGTYEGLLQRLIPEDRERLEGAVKDTLANNLAHTIEYQIVHPSGELRRISCIWEVLTDEKGSPTKLFGTAQDITDVRRAQEESFARQKLETVGTLASGIAHDFNNLLGGVLVQAEVALQELATGSNPQDELKAIRNVALRGSEIVRELMIFAGKESAVVELVDVSRVVKDMLELLKVSVSKHASLQVDLRKNLPPTRANAARLRQVVMNLVTNASDAMGDRDGVIRVTTKGVKVGSGRSEAPTASLIEGDYVLLEVSDTGRGIPLELRAKVFDPFFTTKSAGHGLGLAIVQGIVRNLGGDIHLTSESGKGTTFQVWLPCAGVANEADTDQTLVNEDSAPAAQEATILVVEDEDPLRRPAARILRKTGFQVFEAADGSSAIELLRANGNQIDAILLDMTIPGASSREVIAEATKIRSEIKVILTSAYSQEMIGDAMNAPQVFGFLRKPYQLRKLLETLRSILPPSPRALETGSP